jgi:UDP-N-acetylmuramate--alanine ligase
MKLSDFHSVHFVGIKGIAMTAFAVWAKESGMTVTGSDVDETFPSDQVLIDAGISVFSGFHPEHVSKPDLVIYTGAHGGVSNVEVETAIKLGIPVLPHGKALGLAMATKKQISVAGSHGKTTTSAMIATVLSHAGLDPSYAVGCGHIGGLGLSGHSGHGDYFVAEADEYITDPTHDKTPRFLWQKPEILVVTNIDYDHPDAYGSLEDVQKAFLALQKKSAHCIVNIDDQASKPLLEVKDTQDIITYGESSEALYRVTSIVFTPEKTTFTLLYKEKEIGTFVLKVPGKHNALNAAAVAIACHLAGLSWDAIGKGLREFTGAKRRFEKIGFKSGVTYYDDYAHHPKEIQATLKAARMWYPKRRIIAIFQPHTYSRTKSLLADFGRAFSDADIAVLTDIYASAREHETLGIDGMTVVNELKKNHTHVVYAPDRVHVQSFLQSECKNGDVVFFMGAGDIYTWEKTIL